jgi:ribose transport system permease protein
VIIAILTSSAAGLFNGLLVGIARIPAFIVTLGTMSIASSLTYVISNGNSYAQFPRSYEILGNDSIWGVPYYLILVVVLFVIGSFVLIKTKLGRMMYAIGSNEEAVRLSGVNVKFYTVVPYMITGFLTGIAAIVNSSRLMAVDPTMGKDLQMDTLAAVVIGGTSLVGGRGSLFGTAIGVLLIGFLRNSLNLMGVNPFWQGTAVGGVIIVAVLAERLRNIKHEM